MPPVALRPGRAPSDSACSARCIAADHRFATRNDRGSGIGNPPSRDGQLPGHVPPTTAGYALRCPGRCLDEFRESAPTRIRHRGVSPSRCRWLARCRPATTRCRKPQANARSNVFASPSTYSPASDRCVGACLGNRHAACRTIGGRHSSRHRRKWSTTLSSADAGGSSSRPPSGPHQHADELPLSQPSAHSPKRYSCRDPALAAPSSVPCRQGIRTAPQPSVAERRVNERTTADRAVPRRR